MFCGCGFSRSGIANPDPDQHTIVKDSGLDQWLDPGQDKVRIPDSHIFLLCSNRENTAYFSCPIFDEKLLRFIFITLLDANFLQKYLRR